jgi:hypothetical protein
MEYNGAGDQGMIRVCRQGRFRRRLVRAAPWGLAGAIALQPACYRYVPAELGAVPLGGHLRAVVHEAAAEQLHATYGISGTMLDGRLVGRAGDVLTLSVPSVPLGSPLETHALYQEIPLTAADLVGVEVRKLDAVRTGALVAAGAAATAAITAGALSGVFGRTISGTGGGSSEHVRAWGVRVAVPLP